MLQNSVMLSAGDAVNISIFQYFQYFPSSLVILEITSKAVSHITTEELSCLFNQLHLASSKSQISVFHSRAWNPAMPTKRRENFC